MVTQYPHSITITPKVDPVQGQSGNFTAPVSGTPVTSMCRVEPAGSNPVLTGADGNVVNYAFVVYMPLQTNQFRYGDAVVITLANQSQFTGFIKQQSNGQFNTRLWV